MRKPSKHLNIRTWVGEDAFDSRKEAERWLALRALSRAGEITALERQVSFPLHVNGVKVCRYVADFAYLDKAGVKVVEDVKSPHSAKLPVYRLKAKMFAAQYGFAIREV